MTKLIQTGVILLFLVFSGFKTSDDIKISVAIAHGECGDLGYVIKSGYDSSAIYYKEAKTAAQRKFSNSKRVSVEKNGYSGNEGNYLVIIKTRMKGYNGCDMTSYGIGFGTNFNDAEDDAVSNLKTMNWNWSKSKHGYSVTYKKQY